MEEEKTDVSSENPEGSGQKAVARIEPILAHLKVTEAEVDLDKIREHFAQLWEFEEADSQEPEEQYLTTVGLFIYTTHVTLDNYNINVKRARDLITEALRNWRKAELDPMIEKEKAADNPFKAFVDQNVPLVDEIYTWRHFLLEHKKQDETGWQYKMKQCWFETFFIRYGRTDILPTACNFDKIPWEERQDYVDLKLNNTFAKLGTFCEFKYTPAKPKE